MTIYQARMMVTLMIILMATMTMALLIMQGNAISPYGPTLVAITTIGAHADRLLTTEAVVLTSAVVAFTLLAKAKAKAKAKAPLVRVTRLGKVKVAVASPGTLCRSL